MLPPLDAWDVALLSAPRPAHSGSANLPGPAFPTGSKMPKGSSMRTAYQRHRNMKRAFRLASFHPVSHLDDMAERIVTETIHDKTLDVSLRPIVFVDFTGQRKVKD